MTTISSITGGRKYRIQLGFTSAGSPECRRSSSRFSALNVKFGRLLMVNVYQQWTDVVSPQDAGELAEPPAALTRASSRTHASRVSHALPLAEDTGLRSGSIWRY